MTPAKEVGGDFYDFFLIDPDHFAMVIADVSGKGIPAAAVYGGFQNHVKNTAPERLFPGRNSGHQSIPSIYENNEANMFVTVWIGILTISTGNVVCSNAGHDSRPPGHNGSYDSSKTSMDWFSELWR